MATLKHKKLQVNNTVEKISVKKGFGKIVTPSRMLVCGPSMCGKSTFVHNVIEYRDKIYDKAFERIIYALPEGSTHLHQAFLENLRTVYADIHIIEGLPNIAELNIREDKTPKLLIIEDMMQAAFGSQMILDLFTKDSHHCNCSVIITCQNYFLPTRFGRTFVRNCSEKVIFFDKTDANQLSILTRQIFPKYPYFLQDCFDWIFRHRHSDLLKYLLIDSSTLSDFPYNAIVRSCIFPEKDGIVRMRLFFPDKKYKEA